MSDERYEMPVNGVPADDLARRLKNAIARVQDEFPPHTGVIVFAFDFGSGGGMSYISNSERADSIKALEEWIAYQRTLS